MRHRPNYFPNSESAKKSKSNDFNTLPETNISLNSSTPGILEIPIGNHHF